MLRTAPAVAPQLTNTGVWHAQSILVSGTSVYRAGEFLYQDYLYDDAGANGGVPDPQNPWIGPSQPFGDGEDFSMPVGTYTYPTGPGYFNNAADLVEFRVKPLADATAFRVTLNSLSDPSLVGFTIALGESLAPVAYPFGANVSGPAQLFVTVHGTTGVVADAASGKTLGPASVSVDTYRHQFQVLVPHSTWNPGTSTVRMAIGVGVWDNANNRYLIPAPTRSTTQPGGGGTLEKPPAFFNVGFRYDEQPGSLVPTMPVHSNWWMERSQAESLARGDMTPFTDYVSFAKLRGNVTDTSGVPTTGLITRILASHFSLGQGVDTSAAVDFVGNLQPYAIYVPRQSTPVPYGLTLYVHGTTSNYQWISGTRQMTQLASRGTGTILVSPEGRTPAGSYSNLYTDADVFEAMADVAHHYPINTAFEIISGYSGGGSGTYVLAEHFPDLFAKAFPQAAAASGNLASLRNVPVLNWNCWASEFGEGPASQAAAPNIFNLGYRYELDEFTPGNHECLSYNDQYDVAASWLGTTTVDPNPPHVTYVVDPKFDNSTLGLNADHAYWLSGLSLRSSTSSTGTIDVFTHGFGQGDPPASGEQLGTGSLVGGDVFPVFVYTSEYQTWGPTPTIPVADQLDITATNINTVTIDPSRAHVDCNAKLKVTTDGPLTVILTGCTGNHTFG
jgi:hypothetical protein